MIDDPRLNSIAARTGVPPSLLDIVLRQQLPASVLATFPEAQNDPAFAAEAVAQSLSQNFNQTGSWESALAQYYTGSPHVDPQSATAQQVSATLAGALINAPTHPMDGYGSGGWSPQASAGWTALAQSGQQFLGSGGVLGQSQISWAQRAAASALRIQTGNGASSAAISAQTTAANYAAAREPGGSLATGGAPLLQADPFQSGLNPDITQGFGDSGEQGADYGVAEHTPIFSGFSGTVHVGHYGEGYTGLSVWVDNGQGWQFFAGHLYNTNLVDGQQINAGDVIGYSGGGFDAPEPGHTSGPHVELQIRQASPNGQYTFYDPAQVINQAEQGIFAPEVVQAAASAQQQQVVMQLKAKAPSTAETTPDPQEVEHFANDARAAGFTDPQQIVDALPLAAPLYRQVTGKPPTLAQLVQHVGQTAADIFAHLNAQPHPTYGVDYGSLRKAFNTAGLVSAPLLQRLPTISEAARFAAAGWNERQMHDYYTNAAPSEVQASARTDTQPTPEMAQPTPQGGGGERGRMAV